MTTIINRTGDRGKSSENRAKLLRRVRHAVKQAMPDLLRKRGMKEGGSEQVKIPKKHIREPSFSYGERKNEDYVIPGNDRYSPGDLIEKPQEGSGRGRQGAPGEDGEDEFVVSINRDEFLDYFFEDLELPDLVKKDLKSLEETRFRNAGWQSSGPPAKLSILKTLRTAHLRRIAVSGQAREELEELLKQPPPHDEAWEAKRLELEEKVKNVPFLDNIDLRYHSVIKEPVPVTKAVMFCLMDVSGSMGEREKTLARKFFYLLYLFLVKRYGADNVQVEYVQHTSDAQRVDEQEFFEGTRSGGTEVSSALKLTHQLVTSEFSPQTHNVYVCQASDGDNYESDNAACIKIMNEGLLPIVQYYAYIEIGRADNADHGYETNLWEAYKQLEKPNFVMKIVNDDPDIWPVFRELFTEKVHG